MKSREGAKAEFERLLSEIQVPLRDYISGLVRGSADVKDVIQEANLTIWSKREEFGLGTNFTAWAFRVARFKALSFHRDLGREKLRFFGPEMETVLQPVAAEMAGQLPERLDALRECVDDLDENDQALLQARYRNGVTISEVAKQLGMKENAAHQAVSRIRKKLRSQIRSRLGDSNL